MVERILLLLSQHKMTAKQLTIELGISPSAVSEWKSGKIKPSLENIIRISRIFNVSVDWLLTGEGEINKSHTDEIKSDESELLEHYRQLAKEDKIKHLERIKTTVEVKEELQAKSVGRRTPPLRIKWKSHKKKVPMEVAALSASAGLGNYLHTDDLFETMYFNEDEVHPRADFGIRISGDSMEPLIHDGDIVWVKQVIQVDSGKIGIFIREGEALCKKLVINHKRRRAYLVSLNEKYAPIDITYDESVRTVGEVLLSQKYKGMF